MMPRQLRTSIKRLTRKRFGDNHFRPGTDRVSVSGKVFDEQEMINGVSAVLDGWWTEGKWAAAFEKAFSKYLGVRYVSLANSGSSANLLALSSLTSPVFGERRLGPGDEVVTLATGFPTTVNPILQNRLIPVFIDNDLGTKNASAAAIKKAITPKTRAVMMA